MELQFQKSTCRYMQSIVQEVQHEEVTQEIRLSDGLPDIGRVLASWGQVILRSKEWRSDTVSVSGGLMVWVLYAPEDGSDPRSVDGWIPFQLKWNLPSCDTDGIVRVQPMLRFVDSRNISARKIIVRAGIAAMGEALCPVQTDVYSPADIPEDIEVLTKTYPVRLPREAGEKSFFVDEDISVPASMEAEKILSYSMAAHLQDQKVTGNKAVFRGVTDLHVVLRGQDGKLHVWDTSVPFAQYADLEREYGNDAEMDVMMGITSMELDMNEQKQVRLKCGMLAQYLVNDREMLNLSEDAYSNLRDVQFSEESLQIPSVLETRNERISVQQPLSSQNGEVVDAVFLPDFPQVRRIPDSLEALLSGVFQILCYGEDGLMRSGTSRWEGRFEIPAGENVRVAILPDAPTSVQVKREGTDSVFCTDLNLRLLSTGEQGLPMITGLTVGELKEEDPMRPSLVLSRLNGESLWNIAKRCGSTVELIRNANHLQDDPTDQRMLLIPVS